MKKRGLEPTSQAYTLLFSSFKHVEHNSNVEERIERFTQLLHDKGALKTIHLNAIMTVYAHTRQLDKLKELYGRYKHYGLRPDAATYSLYLKALGSNGQHAEAWETWQQMGHEHAQLIDARLARTIIHLADGIHQPLQWKQGIQLVEKALNLQQDATTRIAAGMDASISADILETGVSLCTKAREYARPARWCVLATTGGRWHHLQREERSTWLPASVWSEATHMLHLSIAQAVRQGR
jgi:pentatricopeptide repeat protein